MASLALQTEISRETARQSLMEISKLTPETNPNGNSVTGGETNKASSELPNGNAENGPETKYRSKLISISSMQPTPGPCANNNS